MFRKLNNFIRLGVTLVSSQAMPSKQVQGGFATAIGMSRWVRPACNRFGPCYSKPKVICKPHYSNSHLEMEVCKWGSRCLITSNA